MSSTKYSKINQTEEESPMLSNSTEPGFDAEGRAGIEMSNSAALAAGGGGDIPAAPAQPAMTDAELARSLQAEAFLPIGPPPVATAGSATMTDEEYAMQLQNQQSNQEIQDQQLAHMMQQMEVSLSTVVVEQEEAGGMEDPIWGRLEVAGGGRPSPCHVLGFAMCPCCLPPFCSAAKKDVYKKILRSWSFAFMAAEVILLLVSLLPGGFAPTDINPMLGPGPEVLVWIGAKNSALIVYRLQLWRLFTPIVLHAGIIHLATNLFVQARIGVFLEREWGWKQWLLVFLGSGLYSSTASCVFLLDSIGVGASGGIMGLLGAWAVQLVCEWGAGDDNAQQQRTMQFVMVFINILVIVGFSAVPYIDWAAHAGGLIAGIALGMVLFGRKLESPCRRRCSVAIGAVLFVAGLAAGLAVLFLLQSPNKALLDVCADMKRHTRNAYHCAVSNSN